MTETELNTLALSALDELAQMYELPERQPGDVDINQLMDTWKCVPKTVQTRMKKLVSAGQFEQLKVRNMETGKVITVYRRTAKEV